MQIELIQNYSEFDKLKGDWDTVYDSDPESQFFLSWIWLSQVFSSNPRGWFILAGRPETGRDDFVAFFPLRWKSRLSRSLGTFCNQVHVAGSYFWADYSGFICRPEFEASVIPEFAARLQQMNWREIVLKNLCVSDRRLNLFLSQFAQATFSVNHLQRKSATDGIDKLLCPSVKLEDSFESYLQQQLTPNRRQKIRRYLRTVDESREFEITLSAPATFDRDLDILVDLWKKKWRGRKGDHVNDLAAKYRFILLEGLRKDIVFMPVLWRADQPLGVLGSFIDRKKGALLYFVAGRDTACRKPPPGLILHAFSIRWAIDKGLRTYDFLRGNEAFKYDFGALDHRIRYLEITTRSGLNLNRSLVPENPDDVIKRASRYLRYRQFNEAETGFRQVLKYHSENQTALRRYGRLLYQTERYGEAERMYYRLLEIDPDNGDGWRGLGKTMLALKQYPEAEKALRKAIKLGSDAAVNTQYYLGRALHAQNRKQAAASLFDRVINLKARDKWDRRKQRKAKKFLRQLENR